MTSKKVSCSITSGLYNNFICLLDFLQIKLKHKKLSFKDRGYSPALTPLWPRSGRCQQGLVSPLADYFSVWNLQRLCLSLRLCAMSGRTITQRPQAISARTPQVNTWVSAEACKQSTLDVNSQTLFLEEKAASYILCHKGTPSFSQLACSARGKR